MQTWNPLIAQLYCDRRPLRLASHPRVARRRSLRQQLNDIRPVRTTLIFGSVTTISSRLSTLIGKDARGIRFGTEQRAHAAPESGRRTDRHAGRRRRRRRPEGPDPGRDRDPARLIGRRVAGERSTDLPDQPDVGGPLPGADVDVGQEVRPRRCRHAGQHPAYRRRPASSAARRHRTGAIDHRAGPGASGRHLAAHPRRQRTAVAAAGVLPGFPAYLRRPPRRNHRTPKPARCWPSPPPRPRRRGCPSRRSSPPCAALDANAA